MATESEALEHIVEKHVNMLETAVNTEATSSESYQDALGQAIELLQTMIDANKEAHS